MSMRVFRCLAAVCLLSAVFFSGCSREAFPEAVDGMLDLRGDSGRILQLRGHWVHHPGTFLEPGEAGKAGPRSLRLPVKLTAPYWGTVSLRVLLPRRLQNRRLILASPELNTAARFFVNGREVFALGQPAAAAGQSRAAFHRRHFAFDAAGEACTIMVHFSNHHLRHGFFAAPELGTEEALVARVRRDDILQLSVAGALLIMLVYHLFLFFLRREYSALYFSIFSFCVCLRLLLTQGYLFALLPEAALTLIKLEYIFFFVLPPFFCLYLRSLGLMEIPPRILRVMLGVFVLSSLLTAFLPILFSSDYVLTFYQLFTLVVVAYILRGLVRATRQRLEDIWFFNWGTFLLVVFAVNDILHFLRVIHTASLSHFGLVIFLFFQAAIIARRHTRLLFRYEELNRDLEQLVARKTGELNNMVKLLRHASLSDSLTGLRNRRYVYEVLLAEMDAFIERWAYTRKHHAVFMLDIDHFKEINDTAGHDAGDRILRRFAEVVAGTVRADDVLVRWGGEEFLLLLKNMDPDNQSSLAAKVLQAIRSSVFFGEGDARRPVTASLGGVLYPLRDDCPELPRFADCIGMADMALYEAKRRGRDRGVLAYPGDGSREGVDGAGFVYREVATPLERG